MRPEDRKKLEAVKREAERPPRKIAKRLGMTPAEVRKMKRKIERRRES